MIAPLLRWYTSRAGFWHSERKEIGFVLQGNQVCIQTNDRYFDLLSRRRKVSNESTRRSIASAQSINALVPG